MKKMLAGTAILIIAPLTAGCSSRNFMVYKDGSSFYITSSYPDLKRVLCDSGDMAKIARDASLPTPLSQELEKHICTPAKIKSQLLALLKSMTPEQYAALKKAFLNNGYEINKVADS